MSESQDSEERAQYLAQRETLKREPVTVDMLPRRYRLTWHEGDFQAPEGYAFEREMGVNLVGLGTGLPAMLILWGETHDALWERSKAAADAR